MPRILVRELERRIRIGAPLDNFVEQYRMQSVVPSIIYEFSKPMHELSKLRERIFRNGIISPVLKQPYSLQLQRRIVTRRDQKDRQAKKHLRFCRMFVRQLEDNGRNEGNSRKQSLQIK